MLDRLIALVASVLGARIPLAVAALEAMSLLLEVLGEITEKQVNLLVGVTATKLTSDSTCLRLQVQPCSLSTGCAGASFSTLICRVSKMLRMHTRNIHTLERPTS